MKNKTGKRLAVLAISGAAVFGFEGTALAAHPHFLVTPNGRCHQVARGQTAISNQEHGGYHRFHENVHLGATGGTQNPALGDGNSRVRVYKDKCPGT